ncbi:unnamed protein product, partial [Adineta steineri]
MDQEQTTLETNEELSGSATP